MTVNYDTKMQKNTKCRHWSNARNKSLIFIKAINLIQ